MPLELWRPAQPKYVKMLLFGASGVGKTVLASTAPEPIFLDLEQGMASVDHEVGRWPITSIEEFREAMRFLTTEEHSFQTIVLDSLTVLMTLIQREVLSTFRPGSNGVGSRNYGGLPNMGDFGAILARFKSMVEAMCILESNVIFIARTGGNLSADQRAEPAFIGKNTTADVSGWMDMIGYMYLQEGAQKEILRVVDFDNTRALTKTRLSIPATRVSSPTWATIFPEGVTISRKATRIVEVTDVANGAVIEETIVLDGEVQEEPIAIRS